MFTGEARAAWPAIGRLKETVGIPVIGNGDIHTPADAAEMLRTTGCDGVMIGRAAMKNPWIFRQTAAHLAGRESSLPTIADRRSLIVGHLRAVAAREPSKFALHKLRKFTGWYTHGLPSGRRLRQQLQSLPDTQALLAAVEAFFDSLEEAAA
jgi:tRNA-dihydrouridine synthase